MGRSRKFFRVPEEESSAADMDGVQEGNQEGFFGEAEYRTIGLRLRSRGVAVDDLTFGEIAYMEREAGYRDQIQYACSAQNPDLLPKKKSSTPKQNAATVLKNRVGGIFESYRRSNNE